MSSSRGLGRFGYPGFTEEKQLFNRKAVAPFPDESKTGATALRLVINETRLPRVAEAATLG